jgi:hypothetical protein
MNCSSLRLQVGGTLNPRRHVYIERPEDAQVLDLLRHGEYVNILSARQMGKSSLMARTMTLLSDEGVHTASVDLSSQVGAPPDPQTFYLTLLKSIAAELELNVDVEDWWSNRPSETVNPRIQAFFRFAVLDRLAGRVVIFLDEIDSTLRLGYADDLFTTMRGLYNLRATTPIYGRLAFCLLGVATPNDLIKDRRTTPYNVGITIELRDFDATRDNLRALMVHLSNDLTTATMLLNRVLHWSSGQPYLTTRLCADLSCATTESDVDRLVERTFSSLNQLSGDTHVQTILAFLDTRLADGLAVFKLYKRILRGRREPDQQTTTHAALKLCGLVKRDREACLVVRNRIYQRLFDHRWIAARTPRINTSTRRSLAWVAFGLILVGGAGGYYLLQNRSVNLARAELLTFGAKIATASDGGLQVELPNDLKQADFGRAVDALSLLGSVTDLTLRSESIVDPRPLSHLAKLQRLDLSGTEVTNLDPLSALVDLRTLNLTRIPASDVEPLRALTALHTLILSITPVSNVEPLRSLTGLEVLDLSATRVVDIKPLAALTTLQSLNLSVTLVADIEPLHQLTALQVLYLSGSKVTDVKPLEALTNLRRLSLAGTDVADIGPLRALTALQWLDLSRTLVANVEPLGALNSLRWLDLSQTEVVDVGVLSGLTQLEVLDLTRSRVPTDQATRVEWPFRDNGDISRTSSPRMR